MGYGKGLVRKRIICPRRGCVIDRWMNQGFVGTGTAEAVGAGTTLAVSAGTTCVA